MGRGTSLARSHVVGRNGVRPSSRRRRSGGFTLFELLVVVFLISILAMLAIPGLRQSRDDRAAFNDARTISGMIHRARTRAAGRGAAHLVTMDGGASGRGRFLLFEALDATAAPAGPNPMSSCRTPGQWTQVSAFAPGTYGNAARIIDGLDLNTTGIRVDADIRTQIRAYGGTPPAAVMCVTPGGSTYVGVGADLNAAIADMQNRIPFIDVLEVRLSRNKAGSPVGLVRRILAAGTSAPRIKSE